MANLIKMIGGAAPRITGQKGISAVKVKDKNGNISDSPLSIIADGDRIKVTLSGGKEYSLQEFMQGMLEESSNEEIQSLVITKDEIDSLFGSEKKEEISK